MRFWRAKDQGEGAALVVMPAPVDWVVAFTDVLSGFVPTGVDLKERSERLAALVRSVPSDELSRLDVGVRSWSSWDAQSWRNLRPLDVARMAKRGGSDLLAGAVLSLHPNGYVREAAVMLLEGVADSEAARWLLLRTLDWVPEVSARAFDAVARRFIRDDLDSSRTEMLVRCLPLLESDRFSSRSTAIRAKELLDSLLVLPAMRPALMEAATSRDRRTRRAAVRVLVQGGDLVEILRGQLQDMDVVAVHVAGRAALADASSSERAAVLLLGAGPTRLRAEAVWVLAKSGRLTLDQLERALRDPSAAVRYVAQQEADRRGLGAVDWYRDRIADDPWGALVGLGDIGAEDDVAVAVHYVDDPKPRVRAAAVRVVARHGTTAELPLLHQVITDGAGRAVREAIRGVARLGVSTAFLEQMWGRCADEQIGCRRLFHLVLPKTDRWTRLRYSLLAAGQPSVALRELGYELLERTMVTWNETFVSASSSDAQTIRDAFARAEPAIRRDRPALAREVGGLISQEL